MKSNIFAETAPYYAIYRPYIPKQVVNHLRQTFTLDGTGTLLDIGCGTGQATYPFAQHFSHTIAIDIDRAMLEEAKKRQPKALSIAWQQRSANDITATEGPYKLAIASRSFHWCDPYPLLSTLAKILLPTAGIAIIEDGSFWTGDEPWQKQIKKTIQAFLGQRRRAGQTTYRPPRETFLQTLSKAGYKKPSVYTLPIKRYWTIDQIIGYLYSTSFAAPYLFGNAKTHFETQLTRTLQKSACATRGTFVENTTFVIHTAFVNP